MRDRHVGALIDVVVRRRGWVRGVRRAEAVLAWPHVVGAEVARFATAVALTNGTLIVEVGDGETAMHLGFQRERILEAYRQRWGSTIVRDLRFRVGRSIAPRPDPTPAARPIADPAELALLGGVGDALPDALATVASAAGRSLAELRARRRAAGWRPCTICGCLTHAHWSGANPLGGDAPCCDTCRRHAALPKVRTAAERLAVTPGAATPALTDDERRVAHALAERQSHARIADLLPRALADPELGDALELAVRCAVALQRGLELHDVPDLDDVDPARDHVDARALRALGRIRPRTPEVP